MSDVPPNGTRWTVSIPIMTVSLVVVAILLSLMDNGGALASNYAATSSRGHVQADSAVIDGGVAVQTRQILTHDSDGRPESRWVATFRVARVRVHNLCLTEHFTLGGSPMTLYVTVGREDSGDTFVIEGVNLNVEDASLGLALIGNASLVKAPSDIDIAGAPPLEGSTQEFGMEAAGMEINAGKGTMLDADLIHLHSLTSVSVKMLAGEVECPAPAVG